MIINKIRKKYSEFILRRFNSHWFNPLYTLYFNLIFLPFKQAIHFPIYVYGWPKLFAQYGSMLCIDKCYSGMIRLNITIPEGPQYTSGNSEFAIWGKVIFRGSCKIASACKINVGPNGVFDIGDKTIITTFCNITAYSKIIIGSGTRITHRCQIFDTNFHYVADFNRMRIKRLAHPIIIGQGCWICNSTTISGGAIIPDKTIVASNSLVNKDFSSIAPESVIGGMPAKFLVSNRVRVYSNKLNSTLSVFFLQNQNSDNYIIDSDCSSSICDWDN